MTRDEAKLKLNDVIEWSKLNRYPYVDDCEVEAIKVAIKALEQQTCEDAVSRQQAIKAMNDLEQEDIEQYGCPIPEGFDGKRAIEALQSLPSVNPQPGVGQWIEDEYEMEVRCSKCGEDNDECSKYCPNCGCKMFELQESEIEE